MVAPSSPREAFLQAAENVDSEKFVQLLQRHADKDDDFTVEEALQSFSRKQHDRLWSGLNQLCTSTLLNSPFEQSEDEDSSVSETLACLQGVVTVAGACLALEKPVETLCMLETVIILHGVLLDLPESASKLQLAIAKLCEKWWTAECTGREELVANTLMYFVVRSLQPAAAVADVKSVDSLRQALSQVNMEEESSVPLRRLLEQCMTRPNYLKQDKGRRFLSSLLALSPSFTERLHKAIKTQLPVCPRSMVDSYGEVYFKAWRNASGANLEKLEKTCIQDLMYHAVHASRVGSRSLASTLRQLLSYFTKQKRQQGVDKMLLTLYEPIIWRAVKVANASVRANAAGLLIDAFPLQDPEANKEDADALTQKQFDILQDLLDDPCPVVRVTGIQGICRIASVFWELIPVHTLESFMTKLIRDMAFDVSTADTRAAVFKGLTYLLDNHLSHPVLKNLLPVLGDFVHDSSEKVRVAFVDLLLKVKGLRTIKFWSITPMENLLAQLVEDSGPVARRLVALLFNSLQPLDRAGEVQLERCVALLRTNPAAGRVFYQYAHRHMSVATAGKFLLLLGQCVLGCVRRARPANGRPGEGHGTDGTEEEKENEAVGEAGEEEAGNEEEGDGEEEEEESLSLQDADVMAGMLEIIAVLWTGINDQLAKPENQTTQKTLVSKFSKALPEFLTVFQEGRALSAVLVIAGYVPSSSIPTFSRGCLSTLKSMSPSAVSTDYGPLLECLVAWGRGSDVLDLIADWLTAGLPTSPKSKKRSRKVSFSEPVKPCPSLALAYMDWLLAHFPCLSALLNSCPDKLQDLATILKNVLVCLERRLLTPDPLSDLLTDEVMVQSLRMHCRLSIHLTARPASPDQTAAAAATAAEEGAAAATLSGLMAWADREILPMVGRVPDLSSGDGDGSPSVAKRTSESEERVLSLGKQILEVILSMSSEAVMLGITHEDFQSALADFCHLLMKTDHGMEFLPTVSRLAYQMSQQAQGQGLEQDGVGPSAGATPGRLLGHVIGALEQRVKRGGVDGNEGPDFPKTLASIKPAVREVLHGCLQRRRIVPDDGLLHSIAAVAVAEVLQQVRADSMERCQGIADLPRLSAFLLGIIGRTQTTLESFVEQLEQWASSGDAKDIDGMMAVLHVLHAISQGPKKVSGIKTCLTAVGKKMEDLQRLSSDLENQAVSEQSKDSPLFQQASQMSQDIARAIGGLS